MSQINGAMATPEDLEALALTGYGHFTSMRVDDDRVKGLDLHMTRLVRDCAKLFGAELDRDQVRGYVAAATAGMTGSYTIRVTVFDPVVNLGNVGTIAANPKVLVTTRPAGPLPPPPMRAMIIPFNRDLPEVKHVGLFGQLYARAEAKRAGYDDVIFCSQGDGRLTEGATWNLGFVDDEGTVVWPKAAVLPGVTTDLLTLAGEFPREYQKLTTTELPSMRAAFATNTSIGVRPITTINYSEFPAADPVVTELQKLYAGIPGEPLR